MQDSVRSRAHDGSSTARHNARALGALIPFVGACLLAGACSSSNSEVQRDGGDAKSGTGGQSGSGGDQAGSGGTTGGTSGCAARTKFTQAVHEILDVTWPAGTATAAGSGKVHIWAKAVFTGNGNSLKGSLQACGSILPPASLSALVGGGMLQIEIPDAAWDAANAPRFDIDASLTGWNVGDTLSYTYPALVGFTMADAATAPWPMSYTGITMTNDPDGDGKPGLTAIPRSGAGYVLPPTSVGGAIGLGARADKVYVVIRKVSKIMHKWTSCEEGEGTSEFMHFNNHVIGCHVMGGSECTAAETKFVDDNRTIYMPKSATIETKMVADGATCADVRNALPI